MNRGGAETMIMNYYRHIDRTKIQFDFLLHREEIGVYEEEIVQLGGRIHRLPALTLTSILSYRRAIARFFDEHPEYRVVHIHAPGVAYFVAREACRHQLPVIIQHSHSCAPDHFDWTVPFRHFFKWAVRRHLTHFFSCGKEAAEWFFGKTGAKKAIILPNAIETEKYRFDSNRRAVVREKMGWEGHYVIGDVARFNHPKNHFQLLTFFVEVLKKRSDALLVLVGDKQGYYRELKSKCCTLGIADKVVFTGGRSDVPDLLQGFDVFVFPSLFEGLSLAMIEAQTAGLRVVASSAIARESAVIPENVSFLPLSALPSVWADDLLRPYERLDTLIRVNKAGFDICQNARWLQNFYLESLT